MPDETESMEVVAEDNDSILITAMRRDFHQVFTLCWDNVGKKVTTRHLSPITTKVIGYMAIIASLLLHKYGIQVMNS